MKIHKIKPNKVFDFCPMEADNPDGDYWLDLKPNIPQPKFLSEYDRRDDWWVKPSEVAIDATPIEGNSELTLIEKSGLDEVWVSHYNEDGLEYFGIWDKNPIDL